MKKTMTLNLKDVKTFASDWFEELIKNRRKLILRVLYVVGLWCGTRIYIADSNGVSESLSIILQLWGGRKVAKTFVLLLIINITPILLSFLNGFFAFGMPGSMFSPCLSGLVTGMVNAWLFSAFRLNGVFFSLLSLVPFAVTITIMLLVSCNEAIMLSGQLARSIFMKESGERGEVKDFFIRHIIIVSVTAVITLLQSVIIMNLFNKLLV